MHSSKSPIYKRLNTYSKFAATAQQQSRTPRVGIAHFHDTRSNIQINSRECVFILFYYYDRLKYFCFVTTQQTTHM